MKAKTWTQRQIDRLEIPGYWVNEYPMPYPSISVECIMNGYVKYIRNDWSNSGFVPEWHTLLWSCAVTKKTSQSTEWGQTWTHYNTYQDMINNCPQVKTFVSGPAPNDF